MLPCRECGFNLFIPLMHLEGVSLGLYNDARFPGRCILALDEHFEHLDEVPQALLSEFNRAASQIGSALRRANLGSRVNYAVLGNVHAHVHMHIIPRGAATDPLPGRPIWEATTPATRMSQPEVERCVRRFLAELTG